MPAGDEPSGAAGGSWIAPSVLSREVGRACLVFGLYLVLYPLWMLSGAHDLYAGLIRAIGGSLVLESQHFPLFSSLDKLRVSYVDFVIILCLCCVLVPGRLGLSTRLRRFGCLALVIAISHILGFVLETYIDAAADVLGNMGLLIFLPWEARILDGARYFLVDVGLNLWPFVVLLLGAIWNSGIALHHSPGTQDAAIRRPRRVAADRKGPRMAATPPLLSLRIRAGAAIVLVLCGVVVLWRHLRESDPRHVQAHVVLGDLFMRDGEWNDALEQYDIAIAHGTTNGDAWINSAKIQLQRGRAQEAARLISRGSQVVSEAAWRDALADMAARLPAGSGER